RRVSAFEAGGGRGTVQAQQPPTRPVDAEGDTELVAKADRLHGFAVPARRGAVAGRRLVEPSDGRGCEGERSQLVQVVEAQLGAHERRTGIGRQVTSDAAGV